MNSILNDCSNIFDELKKQKPLIHHITNYVTVNDCANITLAMGASPVMADAVEEAADIASISSALLINIGTLNSRTVESMLLAGKKANELGIPVILDPVGAGASTYRNETTKKILNEIKISVLRGNVSEIRFIAGLSSNTKGVDASDEDLSSDASKIALELANQYNCTVTISGAVDIISDGDKIITISNGHPSMADITGTGCMSASLIGSFCGAASNKIFLSAVTAMLCMGIAGEIAFEKAGNIGNSSMCNSIIDSISKMTSEDLSERGKINELK